MKKVFNRQMRASMAVLAVIGIAVVVGEDVIVKEGTLGTGSSSPDPRAKVFISDGPDDTYYQDYGLLTVTTDSTSGTENNYGILCEFFSDASREDASGTVAGCLFNYVVGTESSDYGYYYSLAAYTAGRPGYSTNGKTVGLFGVDVSVTNSNNVAGGYYTTTGMCVRAKPVETGYSMTGALTFVNCGLDVDATLDGSYFQATSGSGENFGIKIVTSEQFDHPFSFRPINSYALWLEPFTDNSKLGGGETYGIYQEGVGVMNYFEGDISAAEITDRTPGYTATPQDALSEVLNIRSVDGEIDHSSLPVLARATVRRVEKTNRRMVEHTDLAGNVVEREEYDLNVVEEEGRSLGGMITVLVEAVKGLNEKIENLETQNQTLKAEIAVIKANIGAE